jgi:hypothetical protein
LKSRRDRAENYDIKDIEIFRNIRVPRIPIFYSIIQKLSGPMEIALPSASLTPLHEYG